ncbi:MAG TPA: zf-TFIIB domain-containing protein [Clostridia bacterium]|nr:zf-TFIIB domain-containing protein [Clostridia bacterium]
MTEKMTLKCPNCGSNVSVDCTCCSYCRSTLTVASCPSCFGSVFKGMSFCPWCGDTVDRNEIQNDKPLDCPHCEQTLSLVEVGSAKINECMNCGGIWLSNNTFKKICDDTEKQGSALIFPSPATSELKPASQKRMYIPCPECKQLMHRKNFSNCSGVIVDLCKQHGTWFDFQELQRIIEFIKSGGFDKARKIELERIKEEQRRLERMKSFQNLNNISPGQNDLFLEHKDPSFELDLVSFIGSLFFK